MNWKKRSWIVGLAAMLVVAGLATLTGFVALDAPGAQSADGSKDPLSIGSKAPMTERAMKDAVSGKVMALKDVAGTNGLLVVFSCNTCPWVKAWEDRYLTVADRADSLGVGMVAVNPNTAIRDQGESLEDMKERAGAKGYIFPYVLDKEARLAGAFGATRTPHIYLFNEDMTLVYRGAIDDNAREPDKVENHYLMNALGNMVAGKEIAPTTTRSLGCEIKYGA